MDFERGKSVKETLGLGIREQIRQYADTLFKGNIRVSIPANEDDTLFIIAYKWGQIEWMKFLLEEDNIEDTYIEWAFEHLIEYHPDYIRRATRKRLDEEAKDADKILKANKEKLLLLLDMGYRPSDEIWNLVKDTKLRYLFNSYFRKDMTQH